MVRTTRATTDQQEAAESVAALLDQRSYECGDELWDAIVETTRRECGWFFHDDERGAIEELVLEELVCGSCDEVHALARAVARSRARRTRGVGTP